MVDYIIGGIIIAIVAGTTVSSIVATVKKARKRAEEKTREVDEVVVKGGVRYTPDATIVDQKGNDTVSYVKGDIIIKPRKVCKVGKHEEIRPGKWTILCSNEKSNNIQRKSWQLCSRIQTWSRNCSYWRRWNLPNKHNNHFEIIKKLSSGFLTAFFAQKIL